MRVVTLKAHENAYGPVYERQAGGGLAPRDGEAFAKRPGDVYDHPSPATLIDDKVLEPAKGLDRDGDGHPGGSPAGAESTAARGAAKRKAEAAGDE